MNTDNIGFYTLEDSKRYWNRIRNMKAGMIGEPEKILEIPDPVDEPVESPVPDYIPDDFPIVEPLSTRNACDNA